MAAEKLTKLRLTQIVITLAILTVAFFWRTITFQDVSTQKCVAAPQCSLFVDGRQITVTKSETEQGVYIIQSIPSNWNVTSDQKITRQGENIELKINGNNSNTTGVININDSVTVEISD